MGPPPPPTTAHDTDHPSPARLAAFAAGRVDDAELDAVGRHLADCPACCDRLAA
ncbi:MAG: zf-HC2 domain-containing protein, partial [Gemmataceae bacterium]|nr:zf-HC2 domain-containing protein [Gemmataceae bacterium]